jgi:hypothetical protein
MMRSLFTRFAATVIATTVFGVVACHALEPRPEPSNRLVVIIDGSGSYKKRVAEGVGRVVALLGKMAETKVHRWETNLDRVTLISLDALPAVLWEGTVADLQTMKPETWTKRFQARTDYAACTDVGEAFRLAAHALEGDSRSVGKYLWVFSDLIDEPPTTLVGKCKLPKQPSLPPQGFPWESLADVSVSVFWAPANQVLAWKRAVAEHGLENTFVLHTDSESGAVEIAPPPRRTVAVTEAEQAEARQEIKEAVFGGATWLGKAVGIVVAGFVALILLIAIPARRHARSRRTPLPRPVGPQRPTPPQSRVNPPLRAVPRPPVSGAGRAN